MPYKGDTGTFRAEMRNCNSRAKIAAIWVMGQGMQEASRKYKRPGNRLSTWRHLDI
jgi:hypothetical protein